MSGLTLTPKITFRDADPLQDYFIDRDGNYYSVAMLIDEASRQPSFDCPIAALDLSGCPWDEYNVFDLAFHYKRVRAADLSKPIILDWLGRLADGRHRLIKTIAQGKKTIKAVRLIYKLEPCRKGE